MTQEKTANSKKTKTYEASGEMQEAGQMKKFTRTIIACNEAHAREKLLSQMGANHGLTRRQVKITNMREWEGS